MIGTRTRPATERFATKYRVDPVSGCWLWVGAVASKYGRFFDGARVVGAHRFSYSAHVGPIPEGLQIDHLCRVRLCVNPTHLEPVTARENLLRGETITAREAAQTHCVHGHLFSASNTYVCPRGKRQCRICRRAAKLRQKARLAQIKDAA